MVTRNYSSVDLNLLERRLEMMEKNHKHELGVEIAHHREFQKQIQKQTEENKELKQLLEQKEKALDIANIYSNRAIRENASHTPQWKTSSQSLSHPAHESPREASVRREKSRKRDSLPAKPPKPTKHEELVETERSTQNELEEKLEREKEEAARRQKQFEAELRRKREDEETEALEKVRKEKEFRENELKEKEAKRIQAEKLDRENARLEEEFKKKMADEEEKRRLEKQRLEDEDRKKRWISEKTINKLNEDKNGEDKNKKDELLAKLALTGNKKSESESSIFKLTAVDDAQKIESKMAKEEPKNELLTKLFGNNTNNTNGNSDLFGNRTKEIKTMPWEEVNYGKKTSSNTPNSTQVNGISFKETNDHLNGTKAQNGINRPKLENKLLFPDIHKSNSYVDDIEELVLIK
ncbi:putative lebercilin-like [Brachionus plicatilis]|uniref:Putative lebercilin-like n=1 Tax=Brachionus plicatilis TaxID=10195 RepID=A0A3M7TAC9_BRAPC|nr:putative lebercilin-like [Brachionus plicatilis]